MFKDKIFWGIVFGGLAIFVVWGRTPATSAEQAYEGEPQVIAATFASAWCSACKIIKPRVVRVMNDYTGKPVKFVELDFTFGERDEIAAIATANNFDDLYGRAKGATGFTMLIDRDTGELIDTLTVNHSENAIRLAIDAALVAAEITEPGAQIPLPDESESAAQAL